MASNEYNIDDKYTIVVEEQDTFQLELNKQGPQGERGPIGPVGPQGDKGEKGDQGIQGDVGPKGDTGVSVIGVEEISKVGLATTYRMYFSDGTHFDYQVTDGSIDSLTRESIINIIGYEPASYTSVEGLTTRVATLEERVEDLTNAKFPNVVIIGTPHIEGGQVSNFSNTDYLQFPFVDISRGLPFDIYFSFTTGSDVTTQQNILDSYFGIALAIQNSKGVMALSSNGTSWDIGNVTGTNTILPNTTYYVKCSWTGTQYNASLSTNDTTYTPDMVLSSTLTTNKTTIFIGGSPDLFGAGTAHPFKGTINFNKSRVDVQGVTVWEGMADVGLASRANVSLNNLDEVGEARFNAKQDVLISSTNIKTINGESVLGSGNIEIKGGGSGLEVCDIGMALYIDETKGLRRYLNGQIVDINTNTQAFLNRLQQITTLHPSLLCTEEEWQTAKTRSAFGQVGKFVFNYNGADIVSVRLPRVVNIQGLFDLQNLGMTIEAGLPNITGSVQNALNNVALFNQGDTSSSGSLIINARGTSANSANTGPVSGRFNDQLLLDASRSNPIYGKSTTVQPEAIQYPYFIQISTGSETENNIINEIELNNPYSLFDSKYSDHELNNLSWLKSNGQWNAKAVYPTAYDKLLKVQNGTETVAGLSVKLSTETYTDYDFVLNTADEKFRLPLKNGMGGMLVKQVPVIGDGHGLGLTFSPNGNLDRTFGSVQANGVAYCTYYSGYLSPSAQQLSTGTNVSSWDNGTGANTVMGVTTESGKSGLVADLSQSTVPEGWNLYFYVGETVQNANLIDAGRIGEQLVDKINYAQSARAGMPSNRYDDLTVLASGQTYTAPADGYFAFDCLATNSTCSILMVNQDTFYAVGSGYSNNSHMAIASSVPAKKGEKVSLEYRDCNTIYFRFIYAEGVANT